MIGGMFGVIAVLLTEAHEWAEARWIIRWRRTLKPSTAHEARVAHGIDPCPHP